MTGLEQMTVADLTAEHVGVELIVTHGEHTYNGGLSDIAHGHMVTTGADLDEPLMTCAYLLFLGGRTLMLPADASVLAVAPLDPCDGTPMPEDAAQAPAAPPAPRPARPMTRALPSARTALAGAGPALTATVAVLLAVLGVLYGASSPALSGGTIGGCALIAAGGALLARLVLVSHRVGAR